MNKVATLEQNQTPATYFTPKQIDILKNSICKGVSNEEFEVFLMACAKTQLDPFMRQIYAVKRKSKKPDGSWGESMTIQTGIDGYRLIAERTGKYAPGQEPTYTYDDKGNLLSASAYVKKQTTDGTWHTVSASAYIDEYCQTFLDKNTGEKRPTGLWANMPRTMLSKCAEAQALRKAFPAEMSGIYTAEEMQQADIQEVVSRISLEQASELQMIAGDCDPEYVKIIEKGFAKLGANSIADLPAHMYQRVKDALTKNMEEMRAKQQGMMPMEMSLAEVS